MLYLAAFAKKPSQQIMKNKRYYGVYHREKMTLDIFTTKVDAAAHAGISPDSIRRAERNNRAHVTPLYIVSIAYGINKNQARVIQGKNRKSSLLT